MRKYIIVLAFISIFTSLQAQRDKSDRRQEFKALQIAYITDKLQLTPEESQTFWPIYNAYEEKNNALRGKMRKTLAEDITEEQASEYITSRLSVEEDMLIQKKAYIESLRGVLPTQKVALLLDIEHEFKRKMLKNIREKRKGQR